MTQSSFIPINSERRRFTGLALGSMAMLALAACGGSSDNSGEGRRLREAYDLIVSFMTPADVTEAVGVEAETQSLSTLRWEYGGESLNVSFSENSAGTIVVVAVRWNSQSGSLTNTDFTLN